MADFPYTPNPASITKFFAHVQQAGVPPKVTSQYLVKVGFKSSNDRYLIALLKFLGFLDSSGVPTDSWQGYRNRASAKATVAAALRKAYADLFNTYPDAHRKDNEALRNYFSAHTKVADSTLALIVATFKKLAELGDFEAAAPPEPVGAPAAAASPPRAGKPVVAAVPSSAQLPAVNINIQLQLPATDDAGIYDKLFAALKKHLLSP